MRINFIYKNKFHLSKAEKKQLKDVINYIIKAEDKQIGSLNLIFCSDGFITDFNEEYLKHDYETDIITFHDVDDKGLTEGELLISTETVKNNSVRFKESFENELMRVIIHGILHLCGYQDITRPEKILMRKKENYYLKNIRDIGVTS